MEDLHYCIQPTLKDINFVDVKTHAIWLKPLRGRLKVSLHSKLGSDRIQATSNELCIISVGVDLGTAWNVQKVIYENVK